MMGMMGVCQGLPRIIQSPDLILPFGKIHGFDDLHASTSQGRIGALASASRDLWEPCGTNLDDEKFHNWAACQLLYTSTHRALDHLITKLVERLGTDVAQGRSPVTEKSVLDGEMFIDFGHGDGSRVTDGHRLTDA